MAIMKKTATFAAICALLSAFGATACTKTNGGGNEAPPYTATCEANGGKDHTWTGWTTVTAATCTKDGLEKLECTHPDCGQYQQRVVKAAHSFGEWTGDLQRLCEADATLTRECTCGERETMKITKREHSYSNDGCSICQEPLLYPEISSSPSYADLLAIENTSDLPLGDPFNRIPVELDTYYSLEIAAGELLFLSLAVPQAGQYALYTVGGDKGVTVQRHDASEYYIPVDGNGEYVGVSAVQLHNGELASTVNCGELYWNPYWRGTWSISLPETTSDTTVKLLFKKIADSAWSPEYKRDTVTPAQINGKKAPEPSEGSVATDVDYESEFYFDEWNGYYRLGSKENPGEIIYAAISAPSTRLLSGKSFVEIQEEGPNLILSVGTDAVGNYLSLDYAPFILTSESADGNAYETFANSNGLYPVTAELYDFLRLYTSQNRPADIPSSIWDNPEKRESVAWLSACYYYSALRAGSQANPILIDGLGEVEISVPSFDYTYYKIKLAKELTNSAKQVLLACEDENAVLLIGEKTIYGPFSIRVDASAISGVVLSFGSYDFMADTFTVTLSEPENGTLDNPVLLTDGTEHLLQTQMLVLADGTAQYDGYYAYVVDSACTVSLTTENANAYIMIDANVVATNGKGEVTVTEDMLTDGSYTLIVYVKTTNSENVPVIIQKN